MFSSYTAYVCVCVSVCACFLTLIEEEKKKVIRRNKKEGEKKKTIKKKNRQYQRFYGLTHGDNMRIYAPSPLLAVIYSFTLSFFCSSIHLVASRDDEERRLPR